MARGGGRRLSIDGTINPGPATAVAGFSFGPGSACTADRPEIRLHLNRTAGQSATSRSGARPSSGLIIHGEKDAVVPHKDVTGLVEKLKTQKGIVIEQKIVPAANHFFDGKIDVLMNAVMAYLDRRLEGGGEAKPEPRGRRSGAG